jgi:protease II
MTKSLLQTPPFTRRDEVREVLHGVEVSDPYRWLEDGRALGRGGRRVCVSEFAWRRRIRAAVA